MIAIDMPMDLSNEFQLHTRDVISETECSTKKTFAELEQIFKEFKKLYEYPDTNRVRKLNHFTLKMLTADLKLRQKYADLAMRIETRNPYHDDGIFSKCGAGHVGADGEIYYSDVEFRNVCEYLQKTDAGCGEILKRKEAEEWIHKVSNGMLVQIECPPACRLGTGSDIIEVWKVRDLWNSLWQKGKRSWKNGVSSEMLLILSDKAGKVPGWER